MTSKKEKEYLEEQKKWIEEMKQRSKLLYKDKTDWQEIAFCFWVFGKGLFWMCLGLGFLIWLVK